MRLRQRCQTTMEVILLSQKNTQELEQKPVYINKKFKVEDLSDHSIRNSNCILKNCRLTALLVNLIRNVLQSMKKEVRIKSRLIPYSVETVSSLESMPYLHVPSCRIRGKKARPRCMLCPGAQHSTCIPRRRVISMTPANGCCKVGKCYTPCLPVPPNFCPFHGQGPCPVRPCTPRPTTAVQSKFPPKRESYMHVPCNQVPCNRTLQGGGCVSVTALQTPCCPRPIPCLPPVPSCYDCPTLSPCQPRSKPRAKPKLSRPNLCKRQCVLNPTKKQSNICLDCSAQCTTQVKTEETYVQVQRFPSCHQPQPCLQSCPIPCSTLCPSPKKFCTQQEVNTDSMKYCISTQTSVCVFPEVRCGPSHCCASQPKVAQTGPSRLNVVQSGPSYQICPHRSQVQFSQAVQMQSEDLNYRPESGSRNCACQACCEPMISNVCQPMATGVFIRFPDNMVPNGVYGVSMPTMVTQSGQGPYPQGGNGGATQERRLSMQESGRRQWDQPSTADIAVPAHKKTSDGKQPATGAMHYAPSAAQTDQLFPSSQGYTSQGQANPRIPVDEQIIPPRHSNTFGPWNAQPYDSLNGPRASQNPQAPSTRRSSQGLNGSLGLRFEGMAGPNETLSAAPRCSYVSEYNSQQQSDAVGGVYAPQSMYTSGMGPGNASSKYGSTGNYVSPPQVNPGNNATAIPSPHSTAINYPYGQHPSPGYGPQSHGIPNPTYDQAPPTNAYDPRFVMPGGATGMYGPESSMDPYESRNQLSGQRPNFTNAAQSGTYGQRGRPGPQYAMENNMPANSYGESSYPEEPGLYGPRSLGPVSTRGTPRTSNALSPKTRFFRIDESSSQTEPYGPAGVATAAQIHPYRPQQTGANGPSVSFNTTRPGMRTVSRDPNELRGVYDPVKKRALEESQVVLPEPDFNEVIGQNEALEPSGMETIGQRKTQGRQSISHTIRRDIDGFEMPQALKAISKPKRFYCTQSGQTNTKGSSHVIDVNAVGTRFQDQREDSFRNQDSLKICPYAKGTSGTEGQQSTGQQEMFNSQADAEYLSSPQESAIRDSRPMESKTEARIKKSVIYNPHITDIGDLQSGSKEFYRSQGPKSASRRDSVEETDLAAASKVSEMSIPITESRFSVRTRQTKGPTDIHRNISRPEQGVRISSPKSPQRHIARTPFPSTTSDERIKTRPSSPPLSGNDSTEGTNATITKKPTMSQSKKRDGRLSRGNAKSRPVLSPPEAQAKGTPYHQTLGPDKPVQSRSASPQRKGSDQSRGTNKPVQNRLADRQQNESKQSRASNKPIQSRSGSPHQSQGPTHAKSKRKSVRPKSAEKSKKGKGLLTHSSIDTQADDRVDHNPLLNDKQTGSLNANQETGLQTSPSDTERTSKETGLHTLPSNRPNFNVGTSISQQSIPAPQPAPTTKSSVVCGCCPGKRIASDLADMMPCQATETEYQQVNEYSSGEEGDHGTSTESIPSKSDSAEEVICKKIAEKRISIKSSGTDPPEDTEPCWSQRLGSPCRPFSRLYPNKHRLLSPCKEPYREELNDNCFSPPCRRKIPSRKRLRLTLQNKPPWQNVNSGRNARRPLTSIAVQPLPPCQRIQPWPEPCPLRSRCPNSPTRPCPFLSTSPPSHSPCRMTPKQSAVVKASCKCSNEETVSECKKGKEEGFPCSATPVLVAECQCPSKGTKECKCKRFHMSSSLQALRS